ncbi:MAG: cation:proton antiporter [Candidatus Adiutrix intracellularis]|jgi:multicomponent Na+:H+ antiporter subunit D|nr:MAG: cation:proton antiporter [Candidatus Adiutrix intracellularis]MDR2826797.1 monovalent cation/H+ antiporter subunit D family protein [Candidatus Adiutrix intracellularis]
MTGFINYPLLWPLVITFVAPFAIMLMGRNKNIREGISFVAATLAFLAVARFIPDVLNGIINKQVLFNILPGLSLSLCLDGLGIIFALIAPFLWCFATSYNIGYMRKLNEHAQTRYYFCFGIAIFGAVGVAMSANVFTLYFFYEIISIFTYPLVAHHEDEESFAGAKKYMIYLMGTSKLFLLPAMALTYILSGNLDFSLGEINRGMFLSHDGTFKTTLATAHPWLIQLTYGLYIAGLAKAALMPFHNWLPSAMVAPTPVSALLHAVAVVKAGVFSVSRIILSGFGAQIMHDFGLSLTTAYLAAFTIVVASFIALTKDDLKARLAYSTVSQLSYVIIGVALVGASTLSEGTTFTANLIAAQGGLLHIGHHAFGKITLFFGAGAIYVATHLRSIKKMNGLGRKMPWTFGAFGLASLTMIGIPPVAGFVSKWYLLNGAVNAGQILLMAALLASTILNAGYFAPIFIRAFFYKPDPDIDLDHYHEAPLTMVVPLVFTSLVSLTLGLYPQIFQKFIQAFLGLR